VLKELFLCLFVFVAAACAVDIAKLFLRDCWYFACVEVMNWLFACFSKNERNYFWELCSVRASDDNVVVAVSVSSWWGEGIVTNTAPHGDIFADNLVRFQRRNSVE
jgi:hypothetical protein